MKFSVITLNWNTTDMLIRLYESLVSNTKNEMQFIVVDNGSVESEWKKLHDYFSSKSEKIPAFIRKNYDEYRYENDVIVVKLPENLGFSAGNNIGILYTIGNGSDMIAFINSDIIVDEKDWDEKFKNILVGDVGVVGCAYHPLKWDRNANFKIQPLSDVPVESESVQGAFFAVREDVLHEVKIDETHWFDEDNFPMAHYEETDLQFRLMKNGHKVIWVAVVHQHLHNQSATKKNGYSLNDKIKNINDFKANSNRNKQNLLKKHKDWFFDKK